jgi:gas vesicle protein
MTEKIDSNAGYFLAGLTIGSLIAMFFAPKSGEGTREYLSKKVKEVTRPSFCTTASERVYIAASGCEIEFGGTRGL